MPEAVQSPTKAQYNTLLRKMGYMPVSTVRDNERFLGYIVKKGGKESMFKGAVSQQAIPKIINEVAFNRTLNVLTDKGIVAVQAPRPEMTGRTWYIGQKFLGHLLVEEHECGHVAYESIVPIMADILAQLDVVDMDRTVIDTASLQEKVLARQAEYTMHPLVTKAHVLAAASLVGDNRQLETGLQHGDFTPWHIFALDGGGSGLIDGEHGGYSRPRYTDLAIAYMRLYTRGRSPQAARALLAQFMERAVDNKRAFAHAFVPILAIRALGACHDAMIDWVDHDYKDLAGTLLVLALSGKIKDL